ncbi:putative beta-barrel protein YwiB [compost metagenome]
MKCFVEMEIILAMSEKKKVLVQISSQQESENTSQQFHGEMQVRGNTRYVQYVEEHQAPNQGQVRTLLKITDNTLKIIRHGSVESEQSFSAQQRLPGFYRSPYTSFNLSTVTDTIEISSHGDELTISWVYDLYVYEELNGHFINSLHIQEEAQI